MTIEEIRAEKGELEHKIEILVGDFQKRVSLSVQSIDWAGDYRREPIYNDAGKPIAMIYDRCGVRIKLEEL